MISEEIKAQWEKSFEEAEQKIHINHLNAMLQADLQAARDAKHPGLKRTAASYAKPESAWAKRYNQKVEFMKTFQGDIEAHCQEIINERKKLLWL
jgi:hypothetical protein